MRRLTWRLAVDEITGEVRDCQAGSLHIRAVDNTGKHTWVEVELRSGQALLFGNPTGEHGGSFGSVFKHKVGVGACVTGVGWGWVGGLGGRGGGQRVCVSAAAAAAAVQVAST
jgi:hypothetical protein